jgi:hypothetical protein
MKQLFDRWVYFLECCGVEAYETVDVSKFGACEMQQTLKGPHAFLHMWGVYPCKELLERKVFVRQVTEKLEHMFSTPFLEVLTVFEVIKQDYLLCVY